MGPRWRRAGGRIGGCSLASPADAAVEEGESAVLEERKRPCAAAAEREAGRARAGQQGRESPAPEGTTTMPPGGCPAAAKERKTAPPPSLLHQLLPSGDAHPRNQRSGWTRLTHATSEEEVCDGSALPWRAGRLRRGRGAHSGRPTRIVFGITELAGVGSAEEEIADVASDARDFAKLWLMMHFLGYFRKMLDIKLKESCRTSAAQTSENSWQQLNTHSAGTSWPFNSQC